MKYQDSQKLLNATADLKFLLNKDYNKKAALEFVGNHYLLDKDERNYLQRKVYSSEKSRGRKSKIIPLSKIKGKTLLIDGYNVLITVESICCADESIVVCDDGILRDVNAVFGKYKCKEKTSDALNSIVALVKIYHPANVQFFFDSQVSKSGELARLAEKILAEQEVKGSAITEPNVDYQLVNLAGETNGVVASSDSVIMDRVDYILDIPCFIRKIKKRNLSLF
ncbi:MAG TPA: DUF434 domain-containing protein [Methanobacterium sp.]|nr:DUF434 domain-containing protein [Methanobacterium sp.]